MSDANRTHGCDAASSDATAIMASSSVWLLGLLAAAVVLVALLGPTAEQMLRYERHAVLEGAQYWRLLTAHLVHLSMSHMLLNLIGLLLVAALFPRHYSTTGWLVVLGASVAAIDIGFVWKEPQLDWYAGLSGVLHGGLAAGAIAWWRSESRGLAAALTVILIGKLGWEQWVGALPLAGDIPVVVDAHLYGAIGGGVAGLVLQSARPIWCRIVRPL